MKFTKDHEWINPETGRIGLTDHAAEELGEIVYVEAPEEGAEFAQGDAFAEVESVKTVAEIYAPCDIVIRKTNPALEDNPGLINEDPMGEGWLVEVEISDATALDELMDEDAYRESL